MPDPRLKVSHVAWFVGIEDPILLQSFRKVVSTNTPEPTHNSTVTLPSKPTPTKIPAARYVFTRSGAVWKVVFDGGTEFHIKNTDGAKYLDHLLHNPNKPFGATELEKIIKSEKSDSREDNSIQWAVNPKAKHFAKANLKELEVLLAKAEEEENSGEIAGLKIEIAQVQAHVGSTKLLHGDGGERARNNIRKAIEKVKKNLAKGGKYEKEFGQHIGRCVHLGFENGYYNAEGKIWG